MSSDPDPRPTPGELETWAEHRAALEATLFAAPEAPLVLELRDGALRPR